MQRIKTIVSEKIMVTYCLELDTVVAVCLKTNTQKIFSGFGGIHDLFLAFWETANDEVSFEDTVKFFTPIIGTAIVN